MSATVWPRSKAVILIRARSSGVTSTVSRAVKRSPALCAVFLRHTGKRRGLFGRIMGTWLAGIDHVRDGYAWIVRRLLRVAFVSVVLVVVALLVLLGIGVLRRHFDISEAV